MTDVELPCRNTVNKSLLFLLLLFIIIILQTIAPKKQEIHAEGMTALYHLIITLLHLPSWWVILLHLIGGMRTGITKHHGRCSKRWRGVNISHGQGPIIRCRNQRFAFIFFPETSVKTKSIELSEKNSVIPLISVFCSKSLSCSSWIEELLLPADQTIFLSDLRRFVQWFNGSMVRWSSVTAALCSQRFA